jgi:hypothetical protein
MVLAGGESVAAWRLSAPCLRLPCHSVLPRPTRFPDPRPMSHAPCSPAGADLCGGVTRLGVLADPPFAALFPRPGPPAEAPGRLALIPLRQFAENVSDRPAADAGRSRIDGTDRLGLDLADPGLDAAVLSGCRRRLVAGGAGPPLLDTLLTWCREQTLRVPRGRRGPGFRRRSRGKGNGGAAPGQPARARSRARPQPLGRCPRDEAGGAERPGCRCSRRAAPPRRPRLDGRLRHAG